jgi:hypothetical protein
VKPLIYGYVNIVEHPSGTALARTTTEMVRYADIEGFCYATTFVEFDDQARPAFDELTAELDRAQARDVLVPGLDHLDRGSPGQCVLDRVDPNVRVHVLTGQSSDPSGVS